MSKADHRNNRLPMGIIVIALVALAVVPFIQTRGHDFINFDDNVYITENHLIQQGFTWEGVKWSFTTVQGGYLHPLTWFSHMLDCQLFRQSDGKQWAGGHHLVSMLLHAINTLLVWVVFTRMTGAIWRSALVAGLFAAHPLHVESVAWAAERKDVLSGMFALLTILVYTNYARFGGAGRYVATLGCFALGLLSKPMLVTMPCVLLLLDVWPLRRVNVLGIASLTEPAPQGMDARRTHFPHRGWGRILLEKVPMVFLSALISVYAVIAQYELSSVTPIEAMSVSARVANVTVAYASYLDKLVIPINLAVFYPYHGGWEMGRVVGSAAILLTVTLIAVAMRRRRPWLLIGWLWFVGMLVPVIGFVQVGMQAMADRYTYLPAIGVFLMVIWSIPSARTLAARRAWAALACAVLLVLCVTATVQASHWRNSRTLFDHARRVTDRNFRAHQNLGNAIEQEAQLVTNDPAEKARMLDAAMDNYLKADEIRPNLAEVHESIANVLIQMSRFDEAKQRIQAAIMLNPDSSMAFNSLGVILLSQQKLAEAEQAFRRAVELYPDALEARGNRGAVLLRLGQFAPAVDELSIVAKAFPRRYGVRTNLAMALAGCGRREEAVAELNAILSAKPDFSPARAALQQMTDAPTAAPSGTRPTP